MVVETHTNYLKEVKENEEVTVTLSHFNHDKKRLHYKLEMHEKSTNSLSATTEDLALYMNLNERKVSEFEKEKVEIMDKFINVNKSNFKSDDLVFTKKLKI